MDLRALCVHKWVWKGTQYLNLLELLVALLRWIDSVQRNFLGWYLPHDPLFSPLGLQDCRTAILWSLFESEAHFSFFVCPTNPPWRYQTVAFILHYIGFGKYTLLDVGCFICSERIEQFQMYAFLSNNYLHCPWEGYGVNVVNARAYAEDPTGRSILSCFQSIFAAYRLCSIAILWSPWNMQKLPFNLVMQIRYYNYILLTLLERAV